MKENQRKELLRLTNLNGCYCLLTLFVHNRIFPIIDINNLQFQSLYSEKKKNMFRFSIWILKLQLILLGFEQHKSAEWSRGAELRILGFLTADYSVHQVPQSFWAECRRFVTDLSCFPCLFSLFTECWDLLCLPRVLQQFPSAFTSVQMVPRCSGTHRQAPVGNLLGLCRENLQTVLKQNFLLRKKGGWW